LYKKTTLHYSFINEKYDENMIFLWEKTGIDDGLAKEYIFKNLNNNTKMYRTIWSLNVVKDLDKNNVLIPHIYECTHSEKCEYTDQVFFDKRQVPNKTFHWGIKFSQKKRNEIYNKILLNKKDKI